MEQMLFQGSVVGFVLCEFICANASDNDIHEVIPKFTWAMSTSLQNSGSIFQISTETANVDF